MAPGPAAAPLGWLSNILPGGNKEEDEGIEKCTDVEALISGIEADLAAVLRGETETETVPSSSSNASRASAIADGKEGASGGAASLHSSGSLEFGDKTADSDNDNDGANAKAEHVTAATTPTDVAAFEASSASAPAPPPPSQPLPQPSNSLPKLTPRESDLSARVKRVKALLYAEHNEHGKRSRTGPPVASATVYSILKRPSLVPTILNNMTAIPFEARKDFASVISFLFVCGLPSDGIMPGGTTTAPAPDNDETHKLYEPVTHDFVRYVEENFVEIMDPIVGGHDVTGGNGGSGGGGSAGDNKNSTIAKNDVSKKDSAVKLRRKSTPDVALLCGSLLRSALRHPKLFKLFVSDDNVPQYVYPFMERYVHQDSFEVSGDCLETFKFIMTGGVNPAAPPQQPEEQRGQDVDGEELQSTADIASDFLEKNYDPLFDRFNNRLLFPQASYVIKRASIQLLSTVLLTRSNYPIMMKYIASRHNLRTVMLLLRDPSPHVTLDAFHVFKIFAANPQKTPAITKILVDNRVKLMKYLDGLHKDREGVDVQFRDEKKLVIATLEGLEIEDDSS